jgi:hypothetical protein
MEQSVCITTKWFSTELAKPKDQQKIKFKPIIDDTVCDNITYTGMYIEKEDMFFIGEENEGDFLFSSQVLFWANC